MSNTTTFPKFHSTTEAGTTTMGVEHKCGCMFFSTTTPETTVPRTVEHKCQSHK